MDREPLAQDGEMEARRKRHLVDPEMNPRGKKRMSTDDDPRAGGASSSDAMSSDALAEKVQEEGEMTDESAAPTTAGRSPPSSPSAALSEESSTYSLPQEMVDRLRQIMANHEADEQLQIQRDAELSKLTVESDFCDIDDGSSRSCKARKVAVLASRSVVGLSSFSDEKRIRVCSGFVISSDACTDTYNILTSATLIRSLNTNNILIPDVKITVCLPNGDISDGVISMVDFHYNIAVVKVKSDQKLPEAILISEVIKRGAVLAIGRFYDHGRVMCAQGKIRKQASTFDCSELLVSSCQTTMAGVGGPLVNYSGDVVGINFYGENHTPFLSTGVIVRCLEHWRKYGKIIRPWLGIMYKPIDMLPLRVLEKCAYLGKGLYISDVAEGSPADVAGVCVGDVLVEYAGEVICSAPKFGAMLMDMCEETLEADTLRSNVTIEVVLRNHRDGSIVRKTLHADALSEFNYYRWLDPLPNYNHNVYAREQFMEL
ncbi:hypothetical protein ACQJBY_070179 [Aegilops geniculata]